MPEDDRKIASARKSWEERKLNPALKRGAERFPNPEETIRPLFEFAASLKEDLMTKEMAQLFAEDELSTLKWQKAAWEALKPKTESAQASASM